MFSACALCLISIYLMFVQIPILCVLCLYSLSEIFVLFPVMFYGIAMCVPWLQIGKTKVFLRANQMADLDTRRLAKLGNATKLIQRNAKRYIAWKDYVAVHRAAICIQSICRGLLDISYTNLQLHNLQSILYLTILISN